MKTKLLALALVGLFAINGAMAQEQGDIRLNGGMSLVFDNSVFGFGVGGEYLITDVISAAPSFYFYSKDGGKFNILNIDGRYYFMTDDIQVYGLAGLGMVLPDGGDSETGLNIGAGGIFGLSDALGLNAELKYNTVGDGGLIANVGVVYTIGN